MTKCLDIDSALDIFIDDYLMEASEVLFNQKQEIIYRGVKTLASQLDPDDVNDFLNEVELGLQEYPELQAASAGFRRVLNSEFSPENWENRRSQVDGEETDEAKLAERESVKIQFMRQQFRDPLSRTTAGRAMLYFQRDASQKLMQTFLIDRDGGVLVAEEDIPKRVQEFKQQLLDTIVNYLRDFGYTGNPVLFDSDGVYHNVLGTDISLSRAIDSYLTIGKSFNTDYIKNAYESYRSEKGDWQKSKRFLEAYNAKVLLTSFDDVTKMLLGTIVKPGASKYGNLANDVYVTKISRATNMWGNGFGDDVENIADIISDVVQRLVSSSRKYSWKGGPMKDQYLTFQEFNHTVTKVKKLHQNPISKTIVFNDVFWRAEGNDESKISNTTKRSLDTIRQIKKEQGLPETDPTFEDLLSFISDNPQRHLHSIFDLLCNTDIVDRFPNIDQQDKNLIWTIGKELFGTWVNETDESGAPIPSRSLFDLHHNSNNDRIFEIVTQAADSIFQAQFLQYYEDQEGTLKVRVLQDYAVSQVKNEIMHDMRQTHGMFDEVRFGRFLREHKVQLDYRNAEEIHPKNRRAWYIDNPNYNKDDENSKKKIVQKAQFLKKVTIPVGNLMKIEFENGKLKPLTSRNAFTSDYEAIWKSDAFRKVIKDIIGKDFNTDVELASAYEETFKEKGLSGEIEINYKNLVSDISKLCGGVVFNQAFNNVVVPTVLKNGSRERNKRNVEILRDLQFEGQPLPRINMETGVVEMIADANKDAFLNKLSLAHATTHGLLTSAQVKTGEGTALASQCLSNLMSSHAYQIFTQNKRKTSATRHSTYVNNENGFFSDPVNRREFKSEAAVKVNTDTSAVESYSMSFLGFVGAHIASTDSTTLNRNGHAYVMPDVNSDKTSQTELPIWLGAESRWQPGKTYLEMSNSDLETEMKYEFGQMYDTIVKNINKENLRLAEQLGIDVSQFKGKPAILNYPNILRTITDELCTADTLVNLYEAKNPAKQADIDLWRKQGKTSQEIVNELAKTDAKTLGGLRKSRVVKELHEHLVAYNRTHRRKPIQLSEQIHYLYDKNGYLVPNDTLRAMWGRFNADSATNARYGITDLYPEGHKEAATVEGYFRVEKDLRSVEELMTDGFEVFLLGARSKEKQEEIKYLRDNYPGWMSKSGKMALARIFIPEKYSIGDKWVNPKGIVAKITNIKIDSKGTKTYVATFEDQAGNISVKEVSESTLDATQSTATYLPIDNKPGTWKIIEDLTTFQKYKNDPNLRDNIQIHPMISRLNRISYLASQQYTCAVGGAHYVYKGGGANVLEEEAKRWLASNKRNVCYASTVHKYQNKTLTGPPKIYQIAPIEDIKSTIYSIMGDLDSHKPIDGGMFVLPWLPILENNALGGEAAGLDKKQFGTYYFEDIAAGGIIKTAGFAVTNQRMRRSEAYRNLCKNMTYRTWVKEYAAEDGSDIAEYIDITRDYNGNTINWVQNDSGQQTFYQRDSDDGGCSRYRLARVDAIYTNGTEERIFTGPVPMEWKPTNKYKIYEYPVTAKGKVNTEHPSIAAQMQDTSSKDLAPILRTDKDHEDGVYTINNNWDLFNLVFGGCNSLSLNEEGNLQPSEHSINQMAYALNNVGYKRDIEHNDERFGSEKYTIETIDKIDDQDDVWQPLKYSDIQYAPNIGALKSTQMNVNPKEGMYEDTYLNAMNIMMAQLGIQLDKEHHADASEVSMPTQIIQACANKGYTIEYTSQLYQSLSTLTELSIKDCMDGIMELMPGNENKGKLLVEITNIIVDKLIHTQDDNEALNAVFAHLIEKAQKGQKLTAEDLAANPIPWSDADLYNKVYNDLASHLTNNAIKMKFPGTLAVICPTERVERMYGDRRLGTFADPDKNISEILGLELYQQRVREGQEGHKLIYDAGTHGSNIWDKLSLASNLDTQHHYWVEYTYADGSPVVDEHNNIYKESYTIETPNDYFKLKNLLAYGGSENIGLKDLAGNPISRSKLKVSKVYENVMQGRELGAYNVRFTTTENNQQFNIFDLSSVQALFEFDSIPKTLKKAKDLLDDSLFFERKYALDKILQLMQKQTPKETKELVSLARAHPDLDLTQVVDISSPEIDEAFTSAAFKICKGLTYKAMEADLFKISKDYTGERQVYVNDTLMTVNPESIKTQAYELIMPKVYQSKFGLKEQDQVQEILADKDFFTKRAIGQVKETHVPKDCFHYELKNFNGKHVYIWDARMGDPDPAKFKDKNFYPCEVSAGKFVRRDIDGNTMHDLSSKNDKIMKAGDLGYEVIVTDNPAFYMEHMNYNIAAFNNDTVDEASFQELITTLQKSDSNKAKKFVRTFTDKKDRLKKFKDLQDRNTGIANFTLEEQNKEPTEVSRLRKSFINEGNELWTSFNKSLDIIAGRIPAQSQQSFMPQRVVAFDNNDINTAYVSTFQLFLQGSDLDIDAVTLLGSEFDNNGKYVAWSPYADISSPEALEASQTLPFPTGFELGIEINNKKDSWFTTYDNFIRELFEVEKDAVTLPDGTTTISNLKNSKGRNILKLKELTPERIKLLAKFIREVNTNGLNLKGDFNSNNQWKPNKALEDEWKNIRQLDDDKAQETPNALKELGFATQEDMYDALTQVHAIINEHNQYINTASANTREQMAKNMCVWTMYQVCSTASNLTELMVGVDQSTAPIKLDVKAAKKLGVEPGAVAQSPWNGDDNFTAPGNHYSMHRSFQEGQIGKQCVGIGAVSIKVNSTTQFYMDTLLREGSEEDKQRLLLPYVDKWGRRVTPGKEGAKKCKKAYYIGGKYYYGLANLYDKNSETAEAREVTWDEGDSIYAKFADNSEDIIRLLASIQTEADITPNVAMNLAAMLSVAVDNAKDLALAKINAGPKMFGFYAYGISLGIDIRDLAKIINTPQGRAISKLCEGNIVNGQMGAFSALQAIKKLEGENIYGDLIQFDLNGEIETDYGIQAGGVVFSSDTTQSYNNASSVLRVLMKEWYTANVANNPKALQDLMSKPGIKRKNGQIDTKDSLENMVYQIAMLGKMDECLATVMSNANPKWKEVTDTVQNKVLANGDAWLASIYQTAEYLGKYANLVNTYYSHPNDQHYYARDLKILAQGAEEMRILGSILSSNKGVKSRTEEGITFIENIENAVIERKKLMGLEPNTDDRIDFILFCTDENYRKEAINKYEQVKHSVNILDVVTTAPHFLSYLRACSVPYAAFKVGSAKFRARDKYYKPVIDTLKATKSSDKENAIRGIEAAVNYRMLRNWLAQDQMKFVLPAGGKLFVGRDAEVLTVSEPTVVPLWTENGLATFKYYMEQDIIPSLKSNPNYSTNSFVHGLTTFELTKTGTHSAVTAYTLEGNMMPFTESQIVQLQTYKADFDQMYDYSFPGSNDPRIANGIPSYADAMYIYSQYVYGGKKGQRSLMTLFSNGDSVLSQKFKSYEANVDANNDFDFDVQDLVKWCAPNSNIYNPSTEYFFATSKTEFGHQFYRKKHDTNQKSQTENPEGEEVKKTDNSKVLMIGDSITDLSKQVYLNPTSLDKQMTSTAFSKGLNTNATNYQDLVEVPLEEGSTETWSLVVNDATGTYSLQPSSPISPRGQKILDYVNNHFSQVEVPTINLKDGTFSNGINPTYLKALIEESINVIDNNC